MKSRCSSFEILCWSILDHEPPQVAEKGQQLVPSFRYNLHARYAGHRQRSLHNYQTTINKLKRQPTTLSVSISSWWIDNTSAMMAPLFRMTPFGSPVVPLVYIIVHMFVFCLGGRSWSEKPCKDGLNNDFATIPHMIITTQIRDCYWCMLTSRANSSQEKHVTLSSSASSFCLLEIFPKLTMASQRR